MDTVKLSTPMPDGNKCPQCGTRLPTGALAGLCPACLLQMGAADDTVTDGKQPPFTPPSVAELAPLFPQLEILELIGKGGMGAVYKARQKQLDRFVALKILPPGIGNDAAFAERFTREAKALAKLNHPGIVTLYEFGQLHNADGARLWSQTQPQHAAKIESAGNIGSAAAGAPHTAAPLYYFLMEFVDGVNLRQLLHAGRISAREALAIVPQICDALQFAHDQGIVHRDIKPENILLDRRGRVKVADFGLAKIVGGNEPLTPSLSPSDGERVAKPGEGTSLTGEQVMGTPQYMSPEQRDNPSEVDHRADIYALGVVFYQMLTGELPGKTIAPPSTKVLIDVRLDEVVLRALEKKPELRYQQVSEVKTAVETIATGAAPSETRADRRDIEWRGAVKAWVILFSLMAVAVTWGWFASDKSFSLLACLGAVFAVATVVVLFGVWLVSGVLRWLQRRTGSKPLVDSPSSSRREDTQTESQSHPASPMSSITWRKLKTVAMLLIFVGVWSLMDMLFSNGIRNVAISPGVLGLPIGIGLLNRRKFCRHAAIWCVWAGFIFMLIMLGWLFGKAFGLFGGLDVVAKILGQPMNSAGGAMLTFLFFAAQVVLLPWMFLMLMRDEVRAAFVHGQNKPRPLLEWGVTVLVLLIMFGQVRLPLENRLRTGIYFTDHRIGATTSASVETWSPTLAPGEKPDVDKIRQEASDLMQQGKFGESLQRHVWYHNHALEYDQGQTGVRLSFALSDWMELGRRYPKAKQALFEVRDAKVREFSGGRGDVNLFMELKFINQNLGDEDATYALFQSIEARDPALARQCFFVADDLLVSKGEYDLCLNYIGDPQTKFESLHQDRQLDENLMQTNPQMNEAAFREFSVTRFVTQVRQLIEVLVATGHKAEAEKIREQAVAVLDVPELQSAVSGAEEKIAARKTAMTTFGPVMERVVNSSGEQTGVYGMDFESGQLLTATAKELSSDDLRKKWIVDHGVDLLVVNKGGFKWKLVGPDFKVARLAEGQWDQATPEELSRALDAVVMETEEGWPFYAINDRLEKPLVFALQTGGGAIGLLQITGFTENPRGVKLRYKLVRTETPAASQASEPADLRVARVKLAELRVSYGEQSPSVQVALARLNELERIFKEEPTAPADLREAKARLMELRQQVGPQTPTFKKALARIAELERMSKEEPTAPPDLREAKVHLVESREDYGPQHLEVKKAMARVKELERMSQEEPNASVELREAKAHLVELRMDYTEQHPLVQQALARIKTLEQAHAGAAEGNLALAEQPPVVVETFPASGARDVETGETEIRVRFSKEMTDVSWSWSTAWQDSTPESVGPPHYLADHRTCVLKVRLEPGRTYAWWLNSENFQNFKDRAARPAVPYLLIFQTRQK